jgi:lysophospholipase L1-like esterase
MAGGAAMALLLAEVAVRGLAPEPLEPRTIEPAGISPFQRTPKGLYVYRPGASFSHVYDTAADPRGYFAPDGRISYRINNLGFRGEDVAAERPPGVRRILCLGDSFTFGEGVREEDAWPQRLGALLGPGFQVLNAGVQGYDLDHEGLFLFLHGRSLRPDAVVVGFFMNDAMPFEETVAHQALLAEGPDAVSPLSRVSALWRLLAERRVGARRTELYLQRLRESFASETWRAARGRIGRLREMADHDGFELLAVIFPVLHELDDDYPLAAEHAEVRRAFEGAGIPVLDLLEDFRGYDARELWAHAVDPHPNDVAHGLAAERVVRAIRGE